MSRNNGSSFNAHTLIGLVVVGGCLLACGGCGVGLMKGGISYSSGYRDGHIQKFSHKGIIWKTWEGEMALPGLKMVGTGDSSQLSNVFEFSVLDDRTRADLEGVTAKDFVRVHYEQYFFSPPWFGSTQYRIVKIEKIKE
jgi:hypothetical protein